MLLMYDRLNSIYQLIRYLRLVLGPTLIAIAARVCKFIVASKISPARRFFSKIGVIQLYDQVTTSFLHNLFSMIKRKCNY